MGRTLVLTEAGLKKILRTSRGLTQRATVAREHIKRSRELSESLCAQLVALGYHVEPEHKFHTTRQWRIDVTVPAHRIAVEIEGGFFTKSGGRHNRGPGARRDMEKYNEAVIAGWRMIRVLPEWVKSGRAATYVRRAITGATDAVPDGDTDRRSRHEQRRPR